MRGLGGETDKQVKHSGYFTAKKKKKEYVLYHNNRYVSLCIYPNHRVYDDETQPLCTGAKLNLRDRVLDGVERNSSTVLPGKVGCKGIMPCKGCVSQPGDLVGSFTAVVPRQGSGSGCVVQTCIPLSGLRWSPDEVITL